MPGVDVALALELTNTFRLRRGRAIDALATPRDLAAWLAARKERLGGPRTGEPSADEVLALRELLQTVLAAAAAGRRPPAACVHRLNRLSSGASQYLELSWPRTGEPRVRVRTLSRAPGVTALAAVARSAIELLGGPARQRLRRCAGPRCVLFFLASDPRQTWCSEACGNRARMARYQAARRAGKRQGGADRLRTRRHGRTGAEEHPRGRARDGGDPAVTPSPVGAADEVRHRSRRHSR